MNAKSVGLATLIALSGVGSITTASADTATFASATITGCADCRGADSTGLVVSATGHSAPGGWDVYASSRDHLYVSNGIGALFKLPGRTFDLTGLKLFATNRSTSTTAPVTYTLYMWHLGNPIADVRQITINSRVQADPPLTITDPANPSATIPDPRLQNVESLYVAYGPEIGKNYFIEVRFTPH